MIVDYLRYKITLVIDNLITNNLDTLTKNITKRNVSLEVNTPIQIDQKNILNYFTRELRTYCVNNNIDMDNLALDGYQIVSKTTGIDVYFNMDDINNFSYEPRIMVNLLYTKEMPILKSEQIDDTTIKWYFDDNESVNYLKDEKDNIIAELPLNINYYIESNLIPGGTYTRYICTTNQFKEYLQSTPASITLIVNQRASIYDKFEVEKRNEDIQSINTEYSSKLKAFASGVGDNEDCMVYKADDTKFSRRFILYNKIYGVKASNDIKHNTVKFTYRYKLQGIQDYLAYDAKFTVKITATKCVDYIKDHDPTLFGSPMVCEKELTYTLDDSTQVANIYVYQLFPNLLPRDYKQRYKFDVEIKNISGHSRIYSRDYGYHNIIGKSTTSIVDFSEHGYFDHQFTVAAIAALKQKEYIEYYPTTEYEPLVGAVNGDFQVTPDGIKNMHDTMNEFQTSASVYDKKYFIELESVSPAEGYVKYKFDHQESGQEYTFVNGDGVTFSSEAIFADESEHREFVAQTEEGPYIIDDNKMHKYSYDIKGITVDLTAYKRFELEIVPSINDIVILNAPKTLEINADGSIDMPVDITCRNLQSAIAKWAPNIHNGYYYYNQKEFFLYSKCVSDGKNMILDDVYTRDNVNIKMIMQEKGSAIADKEWHYNLTTKEQLLLDNYHYEWDDNKIWPRPIEVYNDYYMEFAPYYEYYSSPFTFDVEPTKYTNISWSEAGTPTPSQLEVYAIAYDDVYGVWYPPVRLYNGTAVPSSLKKSKILMLKFVLKPSRKPKLQTRMFRYNSEADWKNNRLKFLSYNIYFTEEILMPKSMLSNGVFVSQFIDMGDTVEEVKGRAIKFDPKYTGDIEFYVQHADSKVELTEAMVYANWEKVDINTERGNLKRFIRYMIVLKPKSMIYSMDLILKRYEYTGMRKEEYLPGFGSIYVDAEIKNAETGAKNHEYVLTHELIHDGKDHVLLDSISTTVSNIADAERFNASDIVDVSFYPYDDVIMGYTIDKKGDVAYITSGDTTINETLIENSQGGAEFEITTNNFTLSPIPQQYAPIIIYADNDAEPYTQVFFNNSDGKFILENTEEFESLGFKTLYLKYINIDPLSVQITIDGTSNKDYTISNNVIKFNYEITKKSKIVVKYKIKKTFVANYDYLKDSFEIELYKKTSSYSLVAGNLVLCGTYVSGQEVQETGDSVIQEESISKIKVFYETNKLSACRQLTNISLNPIYNVRHSGYIYICDYQDPPQTVNVYPADEFIYANGKDTMNVLVQVLDKNKNPIENVNVNVVAAKGNLSIINSKTDINGVIHCKYTSTEENCIDIIKAIVDDTAKGQAKIVNRKL